MNSSSSEYQTECIYILQEKGTNYYKIGRSKNIESRIRSLQSGNKNEIVLVAKRECEDTNDAINHEKRMHNVFSNYRVQQQGGTEWFCFGGNDDDIDIEVVIRELRSGEKESIFNPIKQDPYKVLQDVYSFYKIFQDTCKQINFCDMQNVKNHYSTFVELCYSINANIYTHNHPSYWFVVCPDEKNDHIYSESIRRCNAFEDFLSHYGGNGDILWDESHDIPSKSDREVYKFYKVESLDYWVNPEETYEGTNLFPCYYPCFPCVCVSTPCVFPFTPCQSCLPNGAPERRSFNFVVDWVSIQNIETDHEIMSMLRRWYHMHRNVTIYIVATNERDGRKMRHFHKKWKSRRDKGHSDLGMWRITGSWEAGYSMYREI